MLYGPAKPNYNDPDLPPGLEYLVPLDKIIIRQEVDMIISENDMFHSHWQSRNVPNPSRKQHFQVSIGKQNIKFISLNLV